MKPKKKPKDVKYRDLTFPKKALVFCPDCQKTKIQFETRKEADDFMRYNGDKILEENGYKPVRSYYCEACGKWHLTHIAKLNMPSAKSAELKKSIESLKDRLYTSNPSLKENKTTINSTDNMEQSKLQTIKSAFITLLDVNRMTELFKMNFEEFGEWERKGNQTSGDALADYFAGTEPINWLRHAFDWSCKDKDINAKVKCLQWAKVNDAWQKKVVDNKYANSESFSTCFQYIMPSKICDLINECTLNGQFYDLDITYEKWHEMYNIVVKERGLEDYVPKKQQDVCAPSKEIKIVTKGFLDLSTINTRRVHAASPEEKKELHKRIDARKEQEHKEWVDKVRAEEADVSDMSWDVYQKAQKERNLLKTDLLKTERIRYEGNVSRIREWKAKHPTIARHTDKLMIEMSETHNHIIASINGIGINDDKDDAVKNISEMTEDIESYIDKCLMDIENVERDKAYQRLLNDESMRHTSMMTLINEFKSEYGSKYVSQVGNMITAEEKTHNDAVALLANISTDAEKNVKIVETYIDGTSNSDNIIKDFIVQAKENAIKENENDGFDDDMEDVFDRDQVADYSLPDMMRVGWGFDANNDNDSDIVFPDALTSILLAKHFNRVKIVRNSQGAYFLDFALTGQSNVSFQTLSTGETHSRCYATKISKVIFENFGIKQGQQKKFKVAYKDKGDLVRLKIIGLYNE